MAEFSDLELKIAKRLNSILKSDVADSASNREWTVAVKNILGRLGQDLGYQVQASVPKGDFEPEWLFDLIWYTYDSQENFENVQLIAEVEWLKGYLDVKYDFEKLVAGRADLRVFVFQASNPNTIEDYIRRFIKNIASFKYSLKGDRYLFAGFDQKSEVFIYRAFEY
jgi:hypothetical protein